MPIALKSDFLYYEIGHPDFLHSFFSTISYQLENHQWGSRFPALLNELYQGNLPAKKVKKVLKDIQIIRREMAKLAVSKLIWDVENLAAKPISKVHFNEKANNLAEVFVNSNGKNYFDVFESCLTDADESNMDVSIVPLITGETITL